MQTRRDAVALLLGATLGATLPATASRGWTRVPFRDVSDPLGVRFGMRGEGTRLLTDISRLEPITPTAEFFIRTGYALDHEPSWPLLIDGRVSRRLTLTRDELARAATPIGAVTMECAGNYGAGGYGLISTATWRGISCASLFARVAPAADSLVEIRGVNRYEPHAARQATSWIFDPRALVAAGAFLTVEMNGEPLTRDHGAPFRLVVPGWYGCCSIKWVREIVFVRRDAQPSRHMYDYATRTHQPAIFDLAREFEPAVVDVAAVATRLERRGRDYRLSGILWGGRSREYTLAVSADGFHTRDVTRVRRPNVNGWASWSVPFHPPSRRDLSITCGVIEPSERQRRLDSGWYERKVRL
ncbi:MAG TPA: molybdopterin-dependent oxidoreductase [Thermoanaerobaculia bacterium]|nr:molybdopterin-dependent oxidoreductase [Thermoanaerobaculia bacterium]